MATFTPANAYQTASGLTNKPSALTITVDGAEETLRTMTDAQGAFTDQLSGRSLFRSVDGRTEIDSD
jgi:hypothetical protein